MRTAVLAVAHQGDALVHVADGFGLLGDDLGEVAHVVSRLGPHLDHVLDPLVLQPVVLHLDVEARDILGLAAFHEFEAASEALDAVAELRVADQLGRRDPDDRDQQRHVPGPVEQRLAGRLFGRVPGRLEVGQHRGERVGIDLRHAVHTFVIGENVWPVGVPFPCGQRVSVFRAVDGRARMGVLARDRVHLSPRSLRRDAAADMRART